jgi:protein-L-isoaspartate(D-aspartate) O-methyltransferase
VGAAGDREHTRAEDETRADRANAASLVRAARAQGVTDPRVLQALGEIRRSAFVPRELRREVGYDYAIPIGRGQTTSQPSLIALMLEALDLRPDDSVLEIGTGFGYETALLAKLARQVWSVERIEELAQAARRNLEAEEISNVEIVAGDGTLGLARAAPFGGIVVAAAFLRVPAPLADQLAVGRNLVMPVGDGQGDLVKVFQRQDRGLVETRVLCGARFVPLLGENGFDLPADST